ncbi:hypothetical protein Btru_015188 [Bulinus truncatus]|nr:hypothetical protein Btru_015188 [Bulinus truncatus]
MAGEFVRFSGSDDTATIFRGSSLPRLKRRIILAAAGAFVASIFIALIVVSVKYHNSQESNTSSGSQMCLTAECIYVSGSILRKMNKDVDPCTDMYSYACGGWLKNIEVLHPNQEWSFVKELEIGVQKTINELLKTSGHTLRGKNSTAIKKVKKLYQQCMDKESIDNEGVTRVLQLISELGSWTISTNNITPWNNKTWSLQKSIEQMHMLNINGLFTMSVTEETGDDDNSDYILQFQNSGLTLDVNEYAYQQKLYLLQLLVERFASFLSGGGNTTSFRKVEGLLNFETSLAQIVIESEKEEQEIIQLDDLQEVFSPWLNISHYLTARFNGELPIGLKVSINTPGYFNKLKDLIKNTKKEVLANYMMWNFINSITDALHSEFNHEKEEVSYQDLPPRSEMCVDKSTEVLDLAVTALYVDNTFLFNSQSRLEVNATARKIASEIVASLKNLNWLDYRTRDHLQKKSKFLKYNIGYPDWIMDGNTLDKHYKQLKVEGEKYLDNYLNISRYRNSKNLELLWKSPDQEEWIQSPIAVAPFYFNQTVYITTGYMQPPFYDPTLPIPFHYGSIGFGAAQEVLHDFHIDDSWTKPSKDKYLDRSKCFQDQYNKYVVQGQPMNSAIDEIIFDNGAVRHAYQVYKKNENEHKIFPGLNLTDDQLFFLGFSQSMCSVYAQSNETAVKDLSTNEMYRVIGSLSNSVDFAKAFQLSTQLTHESREQMYN